MKIMEILQNQIVGLEMQTPPHPRPLSSIGFVRGSPAPQFFSTLDDGCEVQIGSVPHPFTQEIGATFSNTQSSQTGPLVQSCRRMQFNVKLDTPYFGTFARSFRGPTMQNTAFNGSRHSHGEGGFGSALLSGDCPSASRFGQPPAQPSWDPPAYAVAP